MAQQTIGIGTVANDGTGDPIRDAFDKCNDNFTELYAGLTGLLDFKGSTDASTNPNYPAASKGDFYLVSVAGKVGGAAGVDVEAGDSFLATADNAGGDQATVGTSWTVLQGNTTGGSGGVDVEEEGAAVATASVLNFVGAGVTASDAGGGQVDVTIPGGGAAALDDLSDVDTTTTSPNDGDVLTYDGGTGDWAPEAPASGAAATYTKVVVATAGDGFINVPLDADDGFMYQVVIEGAIGTSATGITFRLTDDNFATVKSGASDYNYNGTNGNQINLNNGSSITASSDVMATFTLAGMNVVAGDKAKVNGIFQASDGDTNPIYGRQNALAAGNWNGFQISLGGGGNMDTMAIYYRRIY